MSRFRLCPSPVQERLLLEHCAHARYVWNLACEQHSHWKPGRASAPGLAEQCRQLTEARRENEWLRSGSVNVQQQALRDFWQARQRFFKSGFGRPAWRRKHRDEGFRITDTCDVERLNRRWARVKVPKVGWVRFRLSRPGLPVAKSYRVTYRNGQWHVAFAVKPGPLPSPGTGEAIGIDRGVVITAALSDGRQLNCPQLTSRERARLRKHQRRAARAPKGSDRKSAEYARVARLKAREAARRKDWCEKASTELARDYDVIRFEKLHIISMTASAKGTVSKPGRNVAQKAGLNRAVLAQGWGLLRRRTGDKAPGRVQDVPAPYTSLRCSACGWIDKNSRKSQAEYACSSCGFTCNADLNAAINVAAGPRRRDDARKRRASVNQQRGPHGPLLESPSLQGGEDVNTLTRMEAGRLGVGEFAFPGPLRDQLVAAILNGTKTTTTGLLDEYERDGEPLPRPGDREVVIDSAGVPVTLIEIVAVRVIRAGDVDLAHALGEGEGYATVADWRAGHEAFWHSTEMREYVGDPAFTVDDDTLAVAVEFRVVGGEDLDLAALLRQARVQAGA